MPRIFFSSLLTGLLLCSVASCTKDDAEPQADSVFQVTQDGTAWQAEGTAIYDRSRQAFSVVGSRGIAGNQTQTLSLSFTVRDVQTPSASLIGVTSLQLVGGDGITSQFRNTDALGTPVLQITRLDTAQRLIEGRFTADLQQEYTPQPAVLRLTEGSFRINYDIGPSAQ